MRDDDADGRDVVADEREGSDDVRERVLDRWERALTARAVSFDIFDGFVRERQHPDRPLEPRPMHGGTVHAGDWASAVPDMLVAEGAVGVAIGESVADAPRELEDAIAEACLGDG